MIRSRAWASFALAAGSAAMPMAAHADVTFHGFGQVVVGSTLSNQHTAFPSKNYSADPSFAPESLLALQVQSPLADRIEATAQIVSTGADGNNFVPKFEWAYIGYQINDDWSLKAGRQRVPLYKYSDELEVGHAYPWIRPPVSVYQGYISNIDGISLNGYYEFGDWTLQPQLLYGDLQKSATAFTGATATKVNGSVRNLSSFNLEAGFRDWLSFRTSASYGQTTISASSLDPAIAAIRQTCQIVGIIPGTGTDPVSNPPIPTCNTAPGTPVVPVDNSVLADGLENKNDTVLFYSAGLSLRKYRFLLLGEYVGFRLDGSLLQRSNEYYASLGYQWGRWTPMLTFGHQDLASSNPGVEGLVNNGAGQSGVPVGSVAGYTIAVPTNNFVNYLVDSERAIADYYEFGLRYDLSKNTALKLDYTRHLNHAPQLTDPSGKPVTYATGVDLLSAAFVFVF